MRKREIALGTAILEHIRYVLGTVPNAPRVNVNTPGTSGRKMRGSLLLSLRSLLTLLSPPLPLSLPPLVGLTPLPLPLENLQLEPLIR